MVAIVLVVTGLIVAFLVVDLLIFGFMLAIGFVGAVISQLIG